LEHKNWMSFFIMRCVCGLSWPGWFDFVLKPLTIEFPNALPIASDRTKPLLLK
jgi:hypothetical protein